MARNDVYAAPDRHGMRLVLDVQSDLLYALKTRVIVPLEPRDGRPAPAQDLNPILTVHGQDYVMATQAIASLPIKLLGRPIASLADRHDDITSALDILLTGF